MATLVVPGVRVETRFDVLPPLPAPSGIVGIVAIVDRPPSPARLVGVTRVAEVTELLGPGTSASAPELIHTLANGASEVMVAAVSNGAAGSLALLNGNSERAVILRARSNGTWSTDVSVDVRTVTSSDGDPVRVSLRVFRSSAVVEEFPDLVVDPASRQDLFDTINTGSVHVVALDPGLGGIAPAPGTYTLPSDGTGVPVPAAGSTDVLLTLLPEPGVVPAGVTVQITAPSADDIRVQVFRDGTELEDFRGLTVNPDSAEFLPAVLLRDSAVIMVRQASSLTGSDRLPAATSPRPLSGGTSPNLGDYQTAIDRLADDPRVNPVLASGEPTRTTDFVRTVHQSLVAHAVAQADEGSPRIAFGSVTAEEQPDLDRIRDHAAAVRNRRFVLVSPAGASGAVAGAISRTNPEISPTFKTVPLFGVPPAAYPASALNRLLGPTHNLLVVQQRAGRGVIVLRGLDTTGDQISVTRVADAAVREVKAIAENFVGQLNTADARTALLQQITATFTRMERAGVLVPSTDGTDPAFLVDVYSTQQDFAQGIVRIDIAVRPVRAADFFHATVRVKN